jgi:N-methylhydantoinase B
VEALENEYPLLMDEYAMIQDSGGPGRTRGGMAIAKQIRAVGPGIVFSARSDSHTVGVAAGVDGGGDGRRARLVRNFGTPQEEELFSKTANIALAAGESVRIETPGGGGYGPPAERTQARIAQDLADGKISLDAARTAYGMRGVRAAEGVGATTPR